MSEDTYSPLLEFTNQIPDFADGFEIGRLWAITRANPDEVIVDTVHARNAEMLIRIAEATHRSFQSDVPIEDWVTVTFAPSEQGT